MIRISLLSTGSENAARLGVFSAYVALLCVCGRDKMLIGFVWLYRSTTIKSSTSVSDTCLTRFFSFFFFFPIFLRKQIDRLIGIFLIYRLPQGLADPCPRALRPGTISKFHPPPRMNGSRIYTSERNLVLDSVLGGRKNDPVRWRLIDFL